MSAAVKMPSVFSDNMLLQRGKKVKIWGTSEPRATVEVEFANQKKSAMADADGKWAVWLSPMKASANPRDLKVYENGEEAARLGIRQAPTLVVGSEEDKYVGLGAVRKFIAEYND